MLLSIKAAVALTVWCLWEAGAEEHFTLAPSGQMAGAEPLCIWTSCGPQWMRILTCESVCS